MRVVISLLLLALLPFGWSHGLDDYVQKHVLHTKYTDYETAMLKKMDDMRLMQAEKKVYEEYIDDSREHGLSVAPTETFDKSQVIGTVRSPVKELEYELTRIDASDTRAIKVYWTIHNISDSPLTLTSSMMSKMNARKISVVDFKHQYRYGVLYDDMNARVNCMLTRNIPPHGRVNCSAVVGPFFDSVPELQNNLVKVYFPGAKQRPLKVFLDM